MEDLDGQWRTSLFWQWQRRKAKVLQGAAEVVRMAGKIHQIDQGGRHGRLVVFDVGTCTVLLGRECAVSVQVVINVSTLAPKSAPTIQGAFTS